MQTEMRINYKDLNKCLDTVCSWIRIVNIKKSVFPKSAYRINIIPIKISVGFSKQMIGGNYDLYK